MTKAEIIEELHKRGEVWTNNSYTKKYLEDYLDGYKRAAKMSLEELRAKIKEKK